MEKLTLSPTVMVIDAGENVVPTLVTVQVIQKAVVLLNRNKITKRSFFFILINLK
jgi:hypothetical protein